jgi:hypothetical protein
MNASLRAALNDSKRLLVMETGSARSPGSAAGRLRAHGQPTKSGRGEGRAGAGHFTG